MSILPDHSPFSSPFTGTGPRTGVVVSHGFTGSPHSVRDWAMSLASAGYAVRLPLLPGHGTSWQELARTRWQDWHAALDAAYLELAEECDVVVVAGLSMGGTLALRIAATRPVAGVVVVNPGLVIDDPRAPLAGILKFVVKSTPAIANDILKPDMDEGAYPRTPVAAAHELNKMFKDTVRRLPRNYGARPGLPFLGGPCGVRIQHGGPAPRVDQRPAGGGSAGKQLPRRYHRQRRARDLPWHGRIRPVRGTAGQSGRPPRQPEGHGQ